MDDNADPQILAETQAATIRADEWGVYKIRDDHPRILRFNQGEPHGVYWEIPPSSFAIAIVSPHAAILIPVPALGMGAPPEQAAQSFARHLEGVWFYFTTQRNRWFPPSGRLLVTVVSRYVVDGMWDYLRCLREHLARYEIHKRVYWHEIPLAETGPLEKVEIRIERRDGSPYLFISGGPFPLTIYCGEDIPLDPAPAPAPQAAVQASGWSVVSVPTANVGPVASLPSNLGPVLSSSGNPVVGPIMYPIMESILDPIVNPIVGSVGTRVLADPALNYLNYPTAGSGMAAVTGIAPRTAGASMAWSSQGSTQGPQPPRGVYFQ